MIIGQHKSDMPLKQTAFIRFRQAFCHQCICSLYLGARYFHEVSIIRTIIRTKTTTKRKENKNKKKEKKVKDPPQKKTKTKHQQQI